MLISRADAQSLDEHDPLAYCRERFALPEGVVYLDGNSLGALPRAAPARLREVAEQQWGQSLITSWNRHGWIELASRVAAKIALLVGATPGEVAVGDSTSINLFKLLAVALASRPERRVILSTRTNFPSDLYMMQGLAALLGERAALRLVDELPDGLEDDVAVMAATQVDFRTGVLLDLRGLTAAAHACGALALWDLSHSAGALPVDLDPDGVDFAVGCGYKYLNGGPGAPAFLYVAERHLATAVNPLSGWLGHESPFAFEVGYRPAPGIARFVCGTPPILSLAALEAGLETFAGVSMAALREKSLALTELFIAKVESFAGNHGLKLASPRDSDRRGSQVSFAHPEGYAIVQALAARGVVGDFRAPDLLRFGFTPLYLRNVDAWDAAAALEQVMESGEWDREEFRRRAVVT